MTHNYPFKVYIIYKNDSFIASSLDEMDAIDMWERRGKISQ